MLAEEVRLDHTGSAPGREWTADQPDTEGWDQGALLDSRLGHRLGQERSETAASAVPSRTMKRVLEFPWQFSAEDEASIQRAAFNAFGVGEVRCRHEEGSGSFLEITRGAPGFIIRRVQKVAAVVVEAIQGRSALSSLAEG
jgi:hypothetical protein